ncbi:hypothetical protein [Metabacillus iocasae]|uniref:Uncharacterized protein n=1 Tax=Priestia iocasae TaxID=2291674 RepID=A0ABS2QZ18_9BACI|nr:hypothetical protein [Metabacillus iocasae]MBM7703951.1 hypothetical protein [Metabacillus iocasae]
MIAYQYIQYQVPNKAKEIEQGLMKWENRDNKQEQIQLKIQDIQQIGASNTYIALYAFPNELGGYAILKKGWNQKFKIVVSSRVNNLVDYDGIETSNGLYGIFVGRNPSNEIHRLKARLSKDNYSFDLQVPKNDYFILYEEISEDVKQPFPADITLLNAEGDDVTLQTWIKQQ